MVDPGLEKDFPLDGETVVSIEPEGMCLCVEHDFRHASLRGPAHKLDQDCAANPTRAPIGEYRHAADVSVG